MSLQYEPSSKTLHNFRPQTINPEPFTVNKVANVTWSIARSTLPSQTLKPESYLQQPYALNPSF